MKASSERGSTIRAISGRAVGGGGICRGTKDIFLAFDAAINQSINQSINLFSQLCIAAR